MARKGQWKPGESGNPSGRPRGAKNRDEVRSNFQEIIEKEFTPEKVRPLLNELEPRDRIQILLKMSEFVLPRLRAEEIPPPQKPDIDIDFSRLTPEQFDRFTELHNKAKSIRPEQADLTLLSMEEYAEYLFLVDIACGRISDPALTEAGS